MTLGEIRKGFTILRDAKRRAYLAIADRWGVLDGESQLRGTPLNTADGMIAATALDHGLIIVTRNVKDFAGLGVRVYNPWEPDKVPH